MADAKISQLPVATTPLAGTELVPVVQGGVTEQTTVEAILTGTVPSGTANGVLFLNGSKVVSSGSALTFDGTNLGVGISTAVARIHSEAGTGVENLRLSSATKSTVNIVATREGVGYWPLDIDAERTQFLVQGSEQMRLTSTGLGIGTNNPGAKLDVTTTGDTQVKVTAGSTNLAWQTFSNGTQTTTVGQENNTGGSLASGTSSYASVFGTNSAYPLQLVTSNVVRATLDSSGNLGLGVTPSAWGSAVRAFEIENTLGLYRSSTAETILSFNQFENSSGQSIYRISSFASLYSQLAGQHRWFTAPSGTAGNAISFTQAMTLDASGNLGIGTTTIGNRLTIGDPGTGLGFINAASGNFNLGLLAGTGSADAYVFQRANANLIVGTNNTERARIPDVGGMVVGTAALATAATDGFLYVPTCAGTPTGTPTTQTGTAPIVVDTTNNKLYFYSGGQWRDAGP